jgi:hypothetical protein
MSWVAVGAAAITVVGGYLNTKSANKGAKDAANASAKGDALSIAEQQREYDQTRTDMLPWLQAGGWGLDQQQAFLKGDRSGFEKSPEYAYARDMGLDAMDHSAASRGGLFGGGNKRDDMRFVTGLAAQNADNYYNKLTGLSQTGYNTGQSLGQFGANMATNIGNAYQHSGDMRASAYNQIGQNNGQFYAGTANTLAGLYGNYYGRRGG